MFRKLSYAKGVCSQHVPTLWYPRSANSLIGWRSNLSMLSSDSNKKQKLGVAQRSTIGVEWLRLTSCASHYKNSDSCLAWSFWNRTIKLKHKESVRTLCGATARATLSVKLLLVYKGPDFFVLMTCPCFSEITHWCFTMYTYWGELRNRYKMSIHCLYV